MILRGRVLLNFGARAVGPPPEGDGIVEEKDGYGQRALILRVEDGFVGPVGQVAGDARSLLTPRGAGHGGVSQETEVGYVASTPAPYFQGVGSSQGLCHERLLVAGYHPVAAVRRALDRSPQVFGFELGAYRIVDPQAAELPATPFQQDELRRQESPGPG